MIKNPIIPATINPNLMNIPLVDEWCTYEGEDPETKKLVQTISIPEEDMIFKTVKGYIILNIADFYNITDEPNHPLNFFTISNKRSYNSPKLREHCIHYLNYFEKYFDRDKELYSIYIRLKYLIDYEENYSKEAFINDLIRYIFKSDISYKFDAMNRHNYSLNLKYRNKRNPVLEYHDEHGMILMKISLFVIAIIPLLTHFAHVKKITKSSDFLLSVYDIILDQFPGVDIYNKLYETSFSNVEKNKENHSILWGMQDIRGNNTTTHSLNCLNNILLNIIPKYVYSLNIINLNTSSIHRNTKFQITDISYEYSFKSLSSSKRDKDMNSEFDRFESFLAKMDEALLLQHKCNCEDTMSNIDKKFGPFNQDEIDFYISELSVDGVFTINQFQKELIFNLFYKYFGDPGSINNINKYDYIKLMITAKRILENYGLRILPYILSSKIERLIFKRTVNKKDLAGLVSSEHYQIIKDKYRSEKIEKQIWSYIAVILSSEFSIISYDYDELHGRKIECTPEIVREEILLYITLI